ncbi:DUF3307 domain-containing protein [Streptomyces sp. NBRC 109706]|uniref:DUF3307 domain-containing protein n=1 Tax=Streptomyces sp. NBRC 109706 TaxID=1550035 RepID=UPI000A5E66AA
MADLFVLLFVAHLLADYPLQTDRLAGRKAGWTEGPEDPNPGLHHHGWGANLIHAGTHVLVCGIALLAGVVVLGADISPAGGMLALAWIGVTHSLIDRRWPVVWWLEHTGQKEFLRHGGAAHVDQAAHLLVLVIAAVALAA